MIQIQDLIDRFCRYARIDTQSDPQSPARPSTEKQKDLSRLLVQELHDMGAADAALDEFGYVYATVPATAAGPVLCFCAHVDTAPDCSGTGVKPIVHYRYDGDPIVLPDDPAQVITVEQHPYLKERIGDDIITASGTTLLGADDKAGVAVLMELARCLLADPAIPHGKIRLLFTPDEEIGRGVDHVDLARLGAEMAYTLDGGERGSLETENFSADAMTVIFRGVAAHPGYAKGKLVNAMKVAARFLDSLPKHAVAPEATEGREGFVHPVRLGGNLEEARVDFIVRDFTTGNLAVLEEMLGQKAAEAVAAFPGSSVATRVDKQYRNMREVIDRYPDVSARAEEAIRRAGLAVRKVAIRGGTDGARLSFLGLPCPNLFAGEMALHGKHEYVSVQDMEKSVQVLLHLVQLWSA